MFPAQSLAEELLARGWRVRLSTDERGARYAGGFPAAVERVVVRSGTFSGRGLVGRLAAPFLILSGVVSASLAMLRDRPALVIGFGGYPSIPALAAAVLTFTPRMIHEQNGVAGRVNRLFAPLVGVVACGTWPTRVRGKSVHVGNPVRAGILAVRAAPYQAGGGNLLVIGGSQGAHLFASVIPQAVAQLPDALRRQISVAQQVRPEDMVQVTATYAELGVTAELQPFFVDVPSRLAAAQLVISRAGASSVADIAVVGRPAILVPYAAALDDHQTANARSLGPAARVIAERDLTAAMLAGQMAEILGDGQLAADMAAKAAALGRPDAAARLADLVEQQAGRH